MSTATHPGVRIHRDADLRGLNSFGIAARAPLLVEVDDSGNGEALSEALGLDDLQGVAPLILGGGSNLLFVENPRVPTLRLVASQAHLLHDDGDTAVLYVDAGMEWHALVMHTLDSGLAGLENLALIPGTTGAAPIQNIGAYGVEVCERIEAVHVVETSTHTRHRFPAADCSFAYRDSLFKQSPDRFIVTGVEFRLQRGGVPQLGYAGLADELSSSGIVQPTARDVANAVIAIRQRKLPDPRVIGNAGSFFKNPIIDAATADELAREYPSLPIFNAGVGKKKLSAAWLIDSLGFKGARDGDAGIAASHALVLVNHGHASGRQLLEFAQRVAHAVNQRYNVRLEPEPRLIGAAWELP